MIPLIFLLSAECRAFILVDQDGRFSRPESIKINVTDDPCTTAGITHEQILEMAQKAIDKWWNQVPTSALHIEIGGIVSSALVQEENTILIRCATHAPYSASENYPAALGGFSGDASRGWGGVSINNVYSGGWSNREDKYLLYVMGHELGHALNLHHSDDVASIMTYNLTDPNLSTLNVENLSQDDMDGITFLYPHKSTAGGLLGSCGSVANIRKKTGDHSWIGVTVMLAAVFLTYLLLRQNTSGKKFISSNAFSAWR